MSGRGYIYACLPLEVFLRLGLLLLASRGDFFVVTLSKVLASECAGTLESVPELMTLARCGG